MKPWLNASLCLQMAISMSACNLQSTSFTVETTFFQLLSKLPLSVARICFFAYQTPFALRHDLRLQQLESTYRQFKHLPGSQLIAQKSFFGNTSGTSNHCEYVLAQLRSFTGNPNTVEAFYAASQTQALQLSSGNPAYLEIEPLEQENILKCRLPDESSAFSHFSDCHHWGIKPQRLAGKPVYYIKLQVQEIKDADARCH